MRNRTFVHIFFLATLSGDHCWSFNKWLPVIWAFYIFDDIRIPPSNLITTPFSIEFSTPSLTILANSSGFPGRGGNSITLVRLDLTLSLIKAVIPLSNRLGATVTTRIPYLETSRVNGSVREAIAPLDAAYETCPGCPSKLPSRSAQANKAVWLKYARGRRRNQHNDTPLPIRSLRLYLRHVR